LLALLAGWLSGCARVSAKLTGFEVRGGTVEGEDTLIVRTNVHTTGLSGQQLVYRVRILDQARQPIISRDRRFRDADGAIAATTSFVVFGSPWAAEGISVAIPAAQLDSDGSEQPAFAELRVEQSGTEPYDRVLAAIPPAYGGAAGTLAAAPPASEGAPAPRADSRQSEIPTPEEEAAEYGAAAGVAPPADAPPAAPAGTEEAPPAAVVARDEEGAAPPDGVAPRGAETAPALVSSAASSAGDERLVPAVGESAAPATAAAEVASAGEQDSEVPRVSEVDDSGAAGVTRADSEIEGPLPPVRIVRPGEAPNRATGESEGSTPARRMYRLYVVRPGDSLWRISDRLLNDGARWREIFDLNRARLDTPDRLPVGTELLIPRE